jgi:hypothetical protein
MVAMLAKFNLYRKFDKNYFGEREWGIGNREELGVRS